MRNAIEVVAAAFLLAGIFVPAKVQDLEGTLKKVKENSTFTIGHRDSSIPLSYLDDKLLPVGFSIELCKHCRQRGHPELLHHQLAKRQASASGS
jgi:glutamate/aspartate transport system substrate-binding protein